MDYRYQDSEGGSKQGSRAHSGELSADDGGERDHEADQGTDVEQAVGRVCALEEALLGEAFLGERVLLCDGRADDGGDDQAVFGASF